MSRRLDDLGLSDEVKQSFAERAGDDSHRLGRVARVDRGECLVITDDGEVRALSDSQRAQSLIAPVTGDWVIITPDDEGEQTICHVFARRTAIVRRDPAEHASDQALVANIDRVAVVHGLDQPANDARIERFLVLAIDSGAEPLVVLNKSDLARSEPAEYDWLQSIGPVVVTSAVNNTGIAELRSHIPPRTTLVFIGPSGAGKSALVNALAGDEVAITAEVRAGDRRGRHTTTVREMIELDGGGIVIDTPGIRAIGLWAADIALDEVFADIAERAADCRFRDCTHRSEPGCAVLEAVISGEVDRVRLTRYHLLWQELAEQTIEIERSKRSTTGRRGRRRG